MISTTSSIALSMSSMLVSWYQVILCSGWLRSIFSVSDHCSLFGFSNTIVLLSTSIRASISLSWWLFSSLRIAARLAGLFSVTELLMTEFDGDHSCSFFLSSRFTKYYWLDSLNSCTNQALIWTYLVSHSFESETSCCFDSRSDHKQCSSLNARLLILDWKTLIQNCVKLIWLLSLWLYWLLERLQSLCSKLCPDAFWLRL